MKKLGIIGWRGMVGQVLCQRMEEMGDFDRFQTTLFSGGLKGQKNQWHPKALKVIADSHDFESLAHQEILISCQGGAYSLEVYPKLSQMGWKGIWIDAASAFRMDDDSCLVLDPVNRAQIEQALDKGIQKFIGANCTVSLMLMATIALFKENLVEWVSSQTYQAASGAGAKNMLELLNQSHYLTTPFQSTTMSALEVEKALTLRMRDNQYPTQEFGAGLAFSLLPWIDKKVESGQTREEWKAQVEANKLLETSSLIPMDGNCVRVGSLRCHSQALTIKLRKNVELPTLEQMIKASHEWLEYVPNEKADTLMQLNPGHVSGSLNIAVGRLRKMTLGEDYLGLFTVGDQLLWGAAEPLRRMLSIIS